MAVTGESHAKTRCLAPFVQMGAAHPLRRTQPSPARRLTVARAARDVRAPWTTEGPGVHRNVSVRRIAVRIAYPTGGWSPPAVVQDFGLGSDLSVTTEVGCLGPFGVAVQLNAPLPDNAPHPPEG